MIPHFCILISPNDKMQFETMLLLKSLEKFGDCTKYLCTIITHDKYKLDPLFVKFVSNKANIIEYKSDKQQPWSHCPRWDLQPSGDLFIALDSDVIILNKLDEFLNVCHTSNKLCGVMAMVSPFKNSLADWKQLYDMFGIKFPDTLHLYSLFKNESPNELNSGPFYFNHGVLSLPCDFLKEIQKVKKYVVEKLSPILGNNFWFPQIVTTIAAELAKIPYEIIPEKFNTIKPISPLTYEHVINKETVIFHYCSSTKPIDNLKDFTIEYPKLNFVERLYNVMM